MSSASWSLSPNYPALAGSFATAQKVEIYFNLPVAMTTVKTVMTGCGLRQGMPQPGFFPIDVLVAGSSEGGFEKAIAVICTSDFPCVEGSWVKGMFGSRNFPMAEPLRGEPSGKSPGPLRGIRSKGIEGPSFSLPRRFRAMRREALYHVSIL